MSMDPDALKVEFVVALSDAGATLTPLIAFLERRHRNADVQLVLDQQATLYVQSTRADAVLAAKLSAAAPADVWALTQIAHRLKAACEQLAHDDSNISRLVEIARSAAKVVDDLTDAAQLEALATDLSTLRSLLGDPG